MQIPVVRGIIDRRILVNFRIDPEILARVLPPPFRPKLAHGFGIAGVCLIRMKQIRPRFVPKALGIASENAAHRIAVEWEENGQLKEGVFIPRRDTSSRLNTLVGGRIFPGFHHQAQFEVRERKDHFYVALQSDDGETRLVVEGNAAAQLPVTSVFQSVAEASAFFEAGSLGYSVTPQSGTFDGLELRSLNWSVTPLAVSQVYSSFFADQICFPPGSVEFDCALLMQGIDHEWHARETLCAAAN